MKEPPVEQLQNAVSGVLLLSLVEKKGWSKALIMQLQ